MRGRTLGTQRRRTLIRPQLSRNPGGATGGSVLLGFTGAQQTWVVPAGVTSVVLDVKGAADGNSGTAGGRLQATVPVTPAETLYVYSGGLGGVSDTGGFNGGGSGDPNCGFLGGAGASDVRQGGFALANRIAVAGGAGAQNCGIGGSRGGGNSAATGEVAGEAGGGSTSATGGGGGASPGGAGGAGTAAGAAGVLGIGGAGGVDASFNCNSGGGGGGGYYGGGGGGGDDTLADCGGEGGGGSNYVVGTATGVTHTRGGGDASNGSVRITWT